MTAPAPSLDNRRATARVMTYEVLRGLAAMARHARWDMIQFLVFNGVWSANTQHLLEPKARSACPTTSSLAMWRP